jgi:hypothetical protein
MHYTTLGPGDSPTWGPYLGDPNDPRNVGIEDDGLAHWEADEIAAEQLASTAADVSDWLAQQTDNDAGWKPVETHLIHDAQLQDAPVSVLLACVMTGTDRQATFARMFLRDRFQTARATEIAERSAELYEAAANTYHHEE